MEVVKLKILERSKSRRSWPKTPRGSPTSSGTTWELSTRPPRVEPVQPSSSHNKMRRRINSQREEWASQQPELRPVAVVSSFPRPSLHLEIIRKQLSMWETKWTSPSLAKIRLLKCKRIRTLPSRQLPRLLASPSHLEDLVVHHLHPQQISSNLRTSLNDLLPRPRNNKQKQIP